MSFRGVTCVYISLNIMTTNIYSMKPLSGRFEEIVNSTTRWKRPSGIIAGLVAAWAIFGMFLAIDSGLRLPPGTFYQMIGLSFGASSSYAMYAGFFLYMITAVIIGIIYSSISDNVRKLYITSVPKGLVTGVIAGVIVWTVLFIPINALVVQPKLQNIVNTESPNSADNLIASQLLKLSNTIIYGSLALHTVFGAVMGFCARLAIA
jgi:hypothetical protein